MALLHSDLGYFAFLDYWERNGIWCILEFMVPSWTEIVGSYGVFMHLGHGSVLLDLEQQVRRFVFLYTTEIHYTQRKQIIFSSLHQWIILCASIMLYRTTYLCLSV
jgi:hypothetical protein